MPKTPIVRSTYIPPDRFFVNRLIVSRRVASRRMAFNVSLLAIPRRGKIAFAKLARRTTSAISTRIYF